MVPLDDATPADAAEPPDPAWYDGLELWRRGLDQATRPDLRRVVVSRLDPPLSRRITGEIPAVDIVSVVPDAGNLTRPPRPRPYRRPPSVDVPSGLLPTTPMLSMARGATGVRGPGLSSDASGTLSGSTRSTATVASTSPSGLWPTGLVRQPSRRRAAADLAAARMRARFARLGMAVGLVLAVGLAWLVLVTFRSPGSEDAPVGEIGTQINSTLVDTLFADRVLSFVGWIATVATTLVLGGVIFRVFVMGSRAGPTGSASGRSAGLQLLRKAAVVGILAELVSLSLRAAAMSDAGFTAAWDLDILRFVLTGRFGDAALVRTAGLALLAGFLPVLPIGPASRRPEPRGHGGYDADGRSSNGRLRAAEPVNGHQADEWSSVSRRPRGRKARAIGMVGADRLLLERVACVVGGLVILLSYAIVGHPQATTPSVLFVPVQCVHVVAVSTWFGGVTCLGVELRQQKREGSARQFAEVVARFSTVAGATIAVAGATGLAMAYSQLDSVNALTETAYGKALLVKVSVLAVPIAIGGYNRQRIVPAIVRRDEPSAWRHLRRTLVVETLFIAVGVLLATAAMTSGGFA